MRLSDFLSGVGSQIVFYYPKLRPICGSVTATLLLCRFAAWDGHQHDPEGWIEKTSDEIEQETGMSYREQVTAREHLRERGLLEEKQERLVHKMFYRLNFEALDNAWDAHIGSSPIDDSAVPETRIRQFGKRQNVSSLTLIQIDEQIDNINDDATHHPQQSSSSTPKLRKKPEPRIVDDATPVYTPSSSTSPPQKSSAKKATPEPPAELKLGETFAEQTLLRLLTEYNDKKGRTTPTHWGNHVQKQLFTDGAQRLTSQQLQAAIYNCLNYNKSGLPDLAQRVKSWADKQPQFDALLQGNGRQNGKAQPFSGFDAMKLLENGEW